MRLSFGDMLRIHIAKLDVLDWILLVLLVAEVAAILMGSIAFARRRVGPAGPRRWCRASVSIGLVAIVLSVVGLAYHHMLTNRMIAELNANVTPADVAQFEMDAFLALTFGLLIGAVGLVGGWVLEWFVDGREGS